jgi:hypothetical protein
MNFGGLLLSGNLDQTITQLNAPHDFCNSGTNHLNSA